ncbi:MAG: hypothetical protein M3N13_10990, partial [Candidatus Eremiobacteraeota bacterium]|nr:hypothetical protein [Candidatus Eremiobacteraeota bacterium]
MLATGLPSVAADDAVGPGPSFDAAQFAPFKKNGGGRIDGIFSLATAKGRKVTATPVSGVTVECYPNVAYAAWSLERAVATVKKGADLSGVPNAAADAKLAPYVRVTRTDSNGGFHFFRLPRGSYVMRASLMQSFPRKTADPNYPVVIGGPQAPKTGPTVFDVTHA